MPNFEIGKTYTGEVIIEEIDNCLSRLDTDEKTMKAPLEFFKTLLINPSSDIITKADYERFKKELNKYTGLPFVIDSSTPTRNRMYKRIDLSDLYDTHGKPISFEIKEDAVYGSYLRCSSNVSNNFSIIIRLKEDNSIIFKKIFPKDDTDYITYIELKKGVYTIESNSRYATADYYYGEGEL